MGGEYFSAVIFKNQLPSSCRITEVVSATRKQFKEQDIDCIQPINGLVRFDFLTMSTRLAFLQRGLKIMSRTVLPMEWVDSMDTPQVKLTVDGLTRTTSDSDLISALKGLGAEPTSKVEPAYYWDHERNCPSNIKSGRRFIHIKKPSTPLPSLIRIGDREANIKYFGQNTGAKSGNIMNTARDTSHSNSSDNQPSSLSSNLLPNPPLSKNHPSQKKDEEKSDDEDVIPPSMHVAPIFSRPTTPARAARSLSRGRSTSKNGKKGRQRTPSTERMESPSKRMNKGPPSQFRPTPHYRHDYFEGLPSNDPSQLDTS